MNMLDLILLLVLIRFFTLFFRIFKKSKLIKSQQLSSILMPMASRK